MHFKTSTAKESFTAVNNFKAFSMWDFLLKNKEWIFSGVGATLLGISLTLGTSRRDKKKAVKSKHNISQNSIEDSIVTNFQADNINFHQNIVSAKDGQPIDEQVELPIHSEDLIKSKAKYLAQKRNLRKFIYRIIEPAKQLNNIIEIRHVVDAAEDKLALSYKVILEELMEMESEGLIYFIFEKPQDRGSPYNRIRLTNKFFKSIKR